MKSLCAASLALALTGLASQRAIAQTDQIVGGITTVTFSSSFIDFTREDGIFLTDLAGNTLQGGAEPLPAVEGAIDLQTGVTDVIFKQGFQFDYIGRTILRVENLILNASQTGSDITGDVIVNGQLLGRQEVFLVNKNPNLSLPLLDTIIGPLVNAGTEVATAAPVAVVVPDTTAAPQ